jgi:hypothetical protein
MNRAQSAFFVFLLVIFCCYAIYKWNRQSVEADPEVRLAVASARTEAQPLIDALEKYHLLHGVYPRSIKDLPQNYLWGKYLYQTSQLNAVYKSLDCQQRVRDLMGWQTAEKRQRMRETQVECLLGYSQFAVKTQVPTAHVRVYAFVVFDSTKAKWDVDWCDPTDNARNYCYDELLKLEEENRQ